MEEGIRFAEQVAPTEVELDDFGQAKALHLVTQPTEEGAHPAELVLPARTVIVAAGTQPNITLAREEPDSMVLDGKYFRALDATGAPATPERVAKPSAVHVLTNLRPDGRAISFFGDLHPSFAGNVVKAMASAKQGYPVVSALLEKSAPAGGTPEELFARLDRDLRATVEEVIRLTPTIVEVVVKAPVAARAFQPGQFYRLQNFESLATATGGTRLAMEGLALTGAWVDRERGLLSTIVLEMGGSSDLCALLKPGEPVILMGPTGTPTEIADERDRAADRRRARQRGAVLDRRGSAHARATRFCISPATSRCATATRWRRSSAPPTRSCGAATKAPGFTPDRPQDKAFVGNIVAALDAYGSGALGRAAAVARRRRPHHRHRLRRHDGGGGAGAPRHPVAPPQAGPQGDRLASTRRCSA